ncbi:hypothetical protein HDU97_009890 [Phlyctochytrium planicorne]|nr:hypothetical protein HDU97_009890 [Phlyctochytrium planicorne]
MFALPLDILAHILIHVADPTLAIKLECIYLGLPLQHRQTKNFADVAITDFPASIHLTRKPYLDLSDLKIISKSSLSVLCWFLRFRKEMISLRLRDLAELMVMDGWISGLKTLLDSGFDIMNKMDLMNTASKNEKLSVIEFLSQNGYNGSVTKAIESAAANGNLPILQFLVDTYSADSCSPMLISAAVTAKQHDIVKYLLSVRKWEGSIKLALHQAMSISDIKMFATLLGAFKGEHLQSLLVMSPPEYASMLIASGVEMASLALMILWGEFDQVKKRHLQALEDIQSPANATAAITFQQISALDEIYLNFWPVALDCGRADIKVAAVTNNLENLKRLAPELDYHQLCIAFAAAAVNGRLCALEILHQHLQTRFTEDQAKGVLSHIEEKKLNFMMVTLVSGGHLEVLKFLKDNYDMSEYVENILELAARHGKSDAFSLFENERGSMNNFNYPTEPCCDLGLLQYLGHLHSIGSPLTADGLRLAVGKGHLDIVRFFYEKEPALFTDAFLVVEAAKGTVFEIVEFLFETTKVDPSESVIKEAVLAAATNPSARIFHYFMDLYDRDITFDIMQAAIQSNSFDNILFLWHRSRNQDTSSWVVQDYMLQTAIVEGHFDVLDFVFQNVTVGTMYFSTLSDYCGNDIAMLKYIQSKQQHNLRRDHIRFFSGITPKTIEYLLSTHLPLPPNFVQFVHNPILLAMTLPILKTMYSNPNTPRPRFFVLPPYDILKVLVGDLGLDQSDWMDTAASNGDLEVVKYLHFNTSGGCSKAAMDGAAAAGHIHVVKFLHEHRTEGCTVDAVNFAAKYGHVDVVWFLLRNRTEGFTRKAFAGTQRVEFIHPMLESK